MNSSNRTYFPNDITPKDLDGTNVILLETKQESSITIVARIVNTVRIQDRDDYKINLIDTATDRILLKENGEPRAWLLKKALETGALSILESDNVILCPSCKKNLVQTTQSICHNCKREETRNFFTTKVKIDGEPFSLDDEQIDAVLADQHSLVTARAGSGKTRVLTAKLVDLFCNQGIRQDEVLAFCFNRDAAKEIQTRLTSKCTVNEKALFQNYDVVTTFHSYAVDIVRPKIKNILILRLVHHNI